MIIVGAKGLAKEILEIVSVEKDHPDSEILLFDNVNTDQPEYLFDRFKILKSFGAVKEHFGYQDKIFTLGLGNPHARLELAKKFVEMGGILSTVISSKALVGSFGTVIGTGSQVMQGVIITNNVQIGKGVLVNLNATISHDCTIGEFTEIACGVRIAGRCKIGKGVFIGTNAIINPDINIGNNSIIGSGAVVIKNVPDNATVVGNPDRIIRSHE